MNVHRWRMLGGKDPTAMELVEKVNLLQKRLVSKTNVRQLYSAGLSISSETSLFVYLILRYSLACPILPGQVGM